MSLMVHLCSKPGRRTRTEIDAAEITTDEQLAQLGIATHILGHTPNENRGTWQ